MRVFLAIVAALALFAGTTEARLREKECEVCIAMVNKFDKQIDRSKHKSLEQMEDVMRKVCKQEKKVRIHDRFCYYLGGTEDAATGFLRAVSQPLKNFLPAERICERMKSKDAAICELTYPEKLDLSKLDEAALKKMRVKKLKSIIEELGGECKGCGDKSDYVRMVLRLKGEQKDGL